MSKKQVLYFSIFLAVVVLALLAVLIQNGLNHGANMFTGLMTVVVAITGILCLAIVGSPFAVMAWYPADGLASLAPPAPAPQTDGKSKSSDDDDEDDDDDGFDDDESMQMDDGDEFDDESFDSGDDDLYEDDAEYDDEDEKW